MNLYDILTTHYTFDETTAIFYRKSPKGLKSYIRQGLAEQ